MIRKENKTYKNKKKNKDEQASFVNQKVSLLFVGRRILLKQIVSIGCSEKLRFVFIILPSLLTFIIIIIIITVNIIIAEIAVH